MFNALLRDALKVGVVTFERRMNGTTKGLYADGVVWINKNLSTTAEKLCILAEELGHHHTSTGDITDQRLAINRKQELRARNWAYERLVPLSGIVEASLAGVKGRHEIAEFLEVTEDFLDAAIKRYQDKYGQFYTVGQYTIFFDPLRVLEMFV